MKAIITAGGKGTRMRPLTFSSNKHLIPLANKPLIFYAIEAIAETGIQEVGINYNPGQKEELEQVLGDGSRWRLKFTYVLQEKPLGLAHIVYCCKKFIGKDKFVMHLGDNIFYGGIKPLADYYRKSKISGLLTIIHHPENRRMGVPYFDKKGRLIKCIEKPKRPPHDWAIPGLYFADHHIFECFRGKAAIKSSARGEYEIPAAFQWLLDHDFPVETMEFKGVWRDPGKFDDWLDTNQFLLDKFLTAETKSKLRQGVSLEGRVKIGKKCSISNSFLRGPVIIGDNVTIGNSFIGPYSSIGDGCQIKKAKIENSILVRNVIVNAPSRPIDSSLVGEGTIIEGDHGPSKDIKLFIGNQCVLKI